VSQLSDSDVDLIAQTASAMLGLTLDSFLGSGAFKRTYRAHDAHGNPVALKVSRRAGVGDERSQREIEVMRRMNSSRFASLQTTTSVSTEAGPVIVLVEELLAGGTLTQRAAANSISKDSLIRIAAVLASAVAELQAGNVAHRDIKPDNVMFRGDDEVPVIVDFGLVRVLDASSLTQTWLPSGPGTPLFAAPEQLLNEKQLIDWRTDQFSLAVTIYYVATGRHPYQRASDHITHAIKRVAEREAPDADFIKFAGDFGMHPLVRMAKPWPVERFCNADDLTAAWGNIGDSHSSDGA